ncbi:spore coat protein [Staphylococcus coagulans]|uniref:spore coat protein n=1 Tax=Staphylococcus coagulans TaxID=74706 RepID=UPI0015F89516|nr:spore coat protein [Staphylococcus coagulans]MBA8764178.1 spore coat protein [Staphylococcus coagulans]MBT2810386.1 spore coat protein [Staphylococcus coagulans]MBT2811781.1 spore coat protein [Staphylococcus coagulans]MBT2819108.1 spore coat protein [Staphylococcus coagulans]MBT2821922.1 spore coat protein [Staphylococcus coagulans]
MRLKRAEKVLHYRVVDNKISEYKLLTQFNPLFINKKIVMCERQIEALYDLNTSTVTCDEVYGMVSVSYPIEKLVVRIVQEKEGLSNFKNRAIENIKMIKQVLQFYTAQERKQVIKYMRSNGRYKPSDVIERLQVDLYQVYIKQRVERQKRINTMIKNSKRVRVNEYNRRTHLKVV